MNMCGEKNGHSFGCSECAESVLDRKHGWVECKSKTFPGKVYYFHTATRCSTWQRPVPRNTQLPRYKKWQDPKSYSASPTYGDQITSVELQGVSRTENSVFTSDVPPSDFELHARRMQIYLQKNTDYSLQAMKFGRGELLRDKLLECYKNAKSELAKKLKEKKSRNKPKKQVVRASVQSAAMQPANKVDKQKTRRLNLPVKIIRECHGIKTISYDPVPFQLSNGVEIPDLSETSVDSVGVQPANIIDEKMLLLQENFALKPLNLSESGTSVSGMDL